MTRIAITGHRGLPEGTTVLIDKALRAELAERDTNLIGLSCLADGADTLFARAVLDCGGMLIAIIPARRYRDGLPAEHHATYDELVAAASDVIQLDYDESTSQAHRRVANACSRQPTNCSRCGTVNQRADTAAPPMWWPWHSIEGYR